MFYSTGSRVAVVQVGDSAQQRSDVWRSLGGHAGEGWKDVKCSAKFCAVQF